MSEQHQAILDMREARKSHVTWAEWLRAHPDEAAQAESRSMNDALGDAAYHDEWTEKYDRVLRLLGAA